MKIRHGFITNSSSSSYIIGLSKKAREDPTMEAAYDELIKDNPHILPRYINNLLMHMIPISNMTLETYLYSEIESQTVYWKEHISNILKMTSLDDKEDLRHIIHKYLDDKYANILKKYPSGTKFYEVTYPHDGDGGTEEDNIMAKFVLPSIKKAIYFVQ